uniref:Chemosensory protein 05 n=1 Tax=Chrysomela lapponica TaxID=153811 RepID=A0A310SB41_CHRLA
MKCVIVLCFVMVCASVMARPEDSKYTSKYDNVDLDAIVKNDRLLRNYVDCLLGKKKCSKDGEQLKGILPDALKTKCSKCSDVQKNGAKKMINHLIKNKRTWWDELEAVYDSDGTYRKEYEAEAKKEGIQL